MVEVFTVGTGFLPQSCYFPAIASKGGMEQRGAAGAVQG